MGRVFRRRFMRRSIRKIREVGTALYPRAGKCATCSTDSTERDPSFKGAAGSGAEPAASARSIMPGRSGFRYFGHKKFRPREGVTAVRKPDG